MYTVEISFGGWATLIRCIKPCFDRAEFLDLKESLALLKQAKKRYSWPLRLTRFGEVVA